jgi:hypothetical protein
MFGLGWSHLVVLLAGYAGSVYSWPWLRTTVTGVEAEVAKLKARITALKP